MKRWMVLVAIVALSGCSQTSLRSENAQLKSRVTALEMQVAELKSQNEKLRPGTALMIDGLRLEPPKVAELRFTPAPPTSSASSRSVTTLAAGEGYIISGGQTVTTNTFVGRADVVRNVPPRELEKSAGLTSKPAPATTKRGLTTRP
jgi:hypothetical protein